MYICFIHSGYSVPNLPASAYMPQKVNQSFVAASVMEANSSKAFPIITVACKTGVLPNLVKHPTVVEVPVKAGTSLIAYINITWYSSHMLAYSALRKTGFACVPVRLAQHFCSVIPPPPILVDH
jgi:hypothetical protein